ncbi:MAG: hypothetical protein KBA46_03250 [Candidatus Omnitrophica bacterium]|nr:hypothetical protein [Candidatus Omnitrophota bacterium]
MHKHHPAIRLSLVICFSAALALLTGEIFARITYVKPWYIKLVEEQNLGYSKIITQHNRLGLRDNDYAAIKPANCKRVLFLGDSFTYGAGVNDDQAIFPTLLETQLNKAFAQQGTKVEVLNGGLRGSLTKDWVKLLSEVRDEFQPDIIVMVFFLRDGTNTTSMDCFFGPIREEVKMRDKNSFLYQYSYLFRFIQETKDRIRLSRKYSQALLEAYIGDSEQTKEWANAKANMVTIKTMAEEMNAQVALVIFPILVELNNEYPFKKICDEVERFGESQRIPTLNLFPAFKGHNATTLWVSQFDQHPNAKAHSIAANAILPFLRTLLHTTVN